MTAKRQRAVAGAPSGSGHLPAGSSAPPRLAAAFLNAILPIELRDDVLGDLQEGYAYRRIESGEGLPLVD